MAGILPHAERRSSALVALYVALSLLLLMVGERLPQSSLRGLGAFLFAPFDRVVLAMDRLGAAWFENQELHQRLAELSLENARLRRAGEENQELRAQLSLPGYREPTLKPLEILALTGDPIPAAATLSAGAKAGIRVGDVVVTSDGLVGRVSEVYPWQSRCTLLSDPSVSVACEVESTGVLGVVRFTASPRPSLTLTAVPYADTVKVGQRVLTSGMSLRYPRGIPVGRVVRIGRDPDGLTQSVVLAPAARFTRLRHVFVIAGPGTGGRP
ncbi:MAG: rod shape-determining protein MreC [Candidatus Eisenbacteria bacterium]|uniref:Cell shape-determining protein MreC n=1 Tax=Eiseniibacteriota bacterium TaxID=2212470 RepID=A0A538UAL0_UNCEI|nr:MAG: rod shape-determining protein MreC [Candidatus Eisenbacteria bacterium]